ncbi:tRNA-uridine aminocarboxypropyltransferase [Vibrio sp. M260118]|uniref:tRNA-uridine aminocarboxypropyltransferase n=1 Tax=Vibrio sp. M260118 TaxID=3020896 RepID=UPI002F3EB7EB
MSQPSHIEGKPCPRCLLTHQCVCSLLPTIKAPFHLALLTHENELTRDTNTGQWLNKSLSSASVHIWQRTQLCQKLKAMLGDEQYQAYLLFPSEESRPIADANHQTAINNKQPLYIVLDATWQEAKKILRKSPWLLELPHVHINPTHDSRYQLRRNQQAGHLCTLEVGCELLKQVGCGKQADHLLTFFDHYMLAYKADKSGHMLKTGV